LGGYNDWLVCCFSLRGPEDLLGYTPIACYSELGKQLKDPNKTACVQYMVLVKDNEYFVDCNRGDVWGRGYGVKPELAESQSYPPHIYDWVFKDVIPNHRK
jgi:hypothetical protein